MTAPGRARRRRLLLATAGVVGLVTVLLLGFFPQEPLRAYAERRLQAATSPQSRIGGLRLRPYALDVELRGLVVEGPTYHLESPRAFAVGTWDLVRGRGLFLKSLEVETPLIAFRPDPRAPASSPLALQPIRIDDVQIRGATIEYRDPTQARPVLVSGVTMSGALGTGTLFIRVDKGDWPGLPALSGDATVTVSTGLDADLVSLTASTPRSSITFKGQAVRQGVVAPDVTFKGRLDAGEIGHLAAKAPPAAEGVLVLENGRASVEAGSVHVEFDLGAARLVVEGWTVNRLAGHLVRDAAGTRMDASADMAGGRVRLEARQAVASGRSNLHGQLFLSNVDLAALPRAAGLAETVHSGRVSGSVALAGDPSAALRLEGQLHGNGVTTDGTSAAVTLRVSGPLHLGETPRVDLHWSGTLEARGAPSAAWESTHLDLAGRATGAFPPAVSGTVHGPVALRGLPPSEERSSVEGTFSSDRGRVTAQIEVRGFGAPLTATIDAPRTGTPRVHLRTEGLDLGRLRAGVTGTASILFDGRGPLSALSGAGQLEARGLAAEGFVAGTLSAKVTATRGALDLAFQLPDWNADGVLHVPAKGPRLKADLRLQDTSLAPLGPMLTPTQSLAGRVSAQLRFDGDPARPREATAHADVTIADITVGRWGAVAQTPFSLHFENGTARLDGLRMKGDGFRLEGSGTAGLEPSSEIDVRMASEVDLTRLPAPTDTSLAGTATADVHVTGSRIHPRADGAVLLRGVSASTPLSGPVRVADAPIALTGDTASVEGLTADLWGGTVLVSARVPFAAAWVEARAAPDRVSFAEAAQIAVTWSHLDLADPVARAAPDRAGLVSGRLAGRADFSGGLHALLELSGSVEVPATALTVQDLAVELAPLALRLDSGHLRTDALRVDMAGTSLTLAGDLDLAGRTVEAKGRGALELRVLSPFLTDTALGGRAEVDVRAAGALDAPELSGRVAVRDGSVRTRAMPESLNELALDVSLEHGTLRLTEGTARLGGGPVTLTGSAHLTGAKVEDLRLDVKGRDMALRYPPGMRSRLDADLVFAGHTGAYSLTGTVTAQRGLYDLDVALDESILAHAVIAEQSPFLRSVALDLRVQTASPVQVRNNLTQLQARGNLSVHGDLQAPAPVGTLEIEPGGRVFLQGREFIVERGQLAYEGDWDPTIDLKAVFTMRPPNDVDHEITALLGGRLASPSLTFESPRLSDAEILSLLTTGTTKAGSDAAFLRMAGSQAAALLAGRVAGSLRGLGLEEVSLQQTVPDVDREAGARLGARLTVTRRVSSQVSILSSIGLQDPEGRFVKAKVEPRRELDLFVQRNDVGTSRAGAGQQFRFGGTRSVGERPPETSRLAEVRIEGDETRAEELRRLLPTRVGARRTAWQLQDDADALRDALHQRGHLEAEVGARLLGTVAVFTVRPGPRYTWRVVGLPQPPDLSRVIERALFEDEALENGRDLLLRELHRRGYTRGRVDARVIEEPGDNRVLAFAVVPGPLLRVEVSFPGAVIVSTGDLLKAAGGAVQFLTDPTKATAAVFDLYRRRQHFAARVDPPRLKERTGVIDIVVPIEEGPPARIARLVFEGSSEPAGILETIAGLELGTPWDDALVAPALDRLRAHYFALGHASVRLEAKAEVRAPDVEVRIGVVEGERRTVGAVTIAGLTRTSLAGARRRLGLDPGDPLDPRRVARAERELRDLPGIAGAVATIGEGNPAPVTFAVAESERAVAGYLLSRDSKEGNDVRLDGELRSLLGRGASLGGSYRLTTDLSEARAAFHVPAGPGDMALVGARQDEDLLANVDAPDGPKNHRRQTEVQVRYGLPVGGTTRLEAGYRFKRIEVEGVLTAVFTLSGFDLSAVHDTRDSPFDARRGHFLIASAHVAPKGVRSDFTFGKVLLQGSLARPVRGWTWAQNYRFGVGRGFSGQEIRSSERFRAGGGNSVRGFETESLGPRDFQGDPQFGEAVVIVNQELRYRHPSGFGGVIFYDAGNVFAKADDLSAHLRHSMGTGLRWQSPVGLLRVDVGFPLQREPGEKRARVFVSLGQAF